LWYGLIVYPIPQAADHEAGGQQPPCRPGADGNPGERDGKPVERQGGRDRDREGDGIRFFRFTLDVPGRTPPVAVPSLC